MNEAWWKGAVIYQIYPRSFQDGDGDGVGDLKGIESRLGYLQALGIDAIWISPIYPSPMADFGYDVADYCDVDPLFGSLADFDRLLAAAHGVGIAVILDFVPNHTSTRHPWFLDSSSSLKSGKRDWYIWRDPAPDGGPPNNWISDFGGSAWEWDDVSRQYFYHAFLRNQADLNWRNPEVRQAMTDVLRFWFDRGVDGFRVDVLWHLIKAADFPDNPPNAAYLPSMGEMHKVVQTYSTDQQEVHEIAADMRKVADEYTDRLLIGEIYLPVERLVTYYGQHQDEMHLPFNFQLIDAPWRARDLARIIANYETVLPVGSWPNWVLGNHDRPRIAAKVGEAQARIAAMLLLTLRGTPTIYYGDELGIGAVAIPADLVRDPRELLEPDRGLGRDPMRTPMPWDPSLHAGFTSGEPWLPLNADWPVRNVAVAEHEPHSILWLYRRLLALRRQHDALSVGAFTLVDADGDVLAYERHVVESRLLIALNLGDRDQVCKLPSWAAGYDMMLSTYRDGLYQTARRDAIGDLLLLPNEGVILGPCI